MPSAIGIKLATPDRPVLCLSGDGSSLYTNQALWSAAHHKIPVVFLILNNGAYRVLKLNMDRYRAAVQLDDRGYQHLDLSEPRVDFVALAKSFGVQATRVEAVGDIQSAVNQAFDSGVPWLLDVIVDGTV
jgi:benzoylformate decarboxylase